MRFTAGFAIVLLFATPALAQPSASAVAAQGGSLPLADVLERIKAYPNLQTQIRLRLVASGQKREAVVCMGVRLPNSWAGLGGARIAPYECTIGKRTVVITAVPTYYDKAGYRLSATDPLLATKAAKVVEARMKWSWK